MKVVSCCTRRQRATLIAWSPPQIFAHLWMIPSIQRLCCACDVVKDSNLALAPAWARSSGREGGSQAWTAAGPTGVAGRAWHVRVAKSCSALSIRRTAVVCPLGWCSGKPSRPALSWAPDAAGVGLNSPGGPGQSTAAAGHLASVRPHDHPRALPGSAPPVEWEVQSIRL